MTNETNHGPMFAALLILLSAFAAAALLRGAEERASQSDAWGKFSAEEICLGWAPDSKSTTQLACAAGAARIPAALERRFGRLKGCERLKLTGKIAAGQVLKLRRHDNGACVLAAGGWLPGPLRLLAHGKIRPNSDSAADLRALPRVGEVRAEAIVDERRRGGPYQNGDDLQRRVRGIGPKTLAGMAPLISF